MKIVLVENFSVGLGTSYVATVLQQAGHDVKVVLLTFSKWHGIDLYRRPDNYFSFKDVAEEIISGEPDIIGFSVYSANFMFFRMAAEAIRKQSGVPIIVGGVLPTLKPEMFLEMTHCDVVFMGEAEAVIADLVDRIPNRDFLGFPNIAYRSEDGRVVNNGISSFIQNLDVLPFYSKDIFRNGSKILSIITSRGCPQKCAYCASGLYSRLIVKPGFPIVRKRSVDNVIYEICESIRMFDYKRVCFMDDYFITTKKWIAEFADKYSAEVRLPYDCVAFPGTINEEIAWNLARSGCRIVYMGFQTAAEEYKREVLKRTEPNEKVIRAVNSLKKYGVKVSLDHIFNLPGETKDDLRKSLHFYIDHSIDSLSIAFLNYYPGSDLARYARDEGYMSEDQYQAIMRNELIGEQNFMGTVLDKKRAKRQVQDALLFRMINLLPGRLLKWMWRMEIQKFLPTTRLFYYVVSSVAVGKELGLRRLVHIFSYAFQNKNT